jgi:hypothetical protein
MLTGEGTAMNKALLLEWAFEDAEKNEHFYHIEADTEDRRHEILLEDLQNLRGGKINLPRPLPTTPSKAVPLLRKHFKDNVTLTSRVLNHLFPDQYLYYRFSKLEEEIFRSFEFFSSVVPEFGFSFARIGRTGFDRYLDVNTALLGLFNDMYPELKDPQARVAWFLYEGLGRLFLEKSDYHRYWIMVTRKENFAELDSSDALNWSARKEMQPDDLVFMYRTSPRMAITDIFRVQDEPVFDPWTGWEGFWVNLGRVCRIEDITFAHLRDDRHLRDWNIVRKQFHGVIVEPVSHTVYNRLLEKVPQDIRTSHELEPEPTANVGRSGQFESEAHFEDEVIEPLLKRWNLDYQRQYRSRFRFGSQDHFGIIDFYVSDGRGPITLVESKFRILDENDLKEATDQGKSYALMLGLACFVVASPEGLWVYSLNRHKESLETHISLDQLEARDEEIRSTLLKLKLP